MHISFQHTQTQTQKMTLFTNGIKKVVSNVAHAKEAWPLLGFVAMAASIGAYAITSHLQRNIDVSVAGDKRELSFDRNTRYQGNESHHSLFSRLKGGRTQILPRWNERMSRPRDDDDDDRVLHHHHEQRQHA